MHVSRALLKNTRASLHFHRRFFIFLAALLVVIIALVAVCSGLPQIITAGDTSSGGDSGGGTNSGYYSFNSFTDDEPTPTPTSPPTSTPTPTFPPFNELPEYGLGGGLVALFVGFVAFTIFIRRTKSVRKEA